MSPPRRRCTSRSSRRPRPAARTPWAAGGTLVPPSHPAEATDWQRIGERGTRDRAAKKRHAGRGAQVRCVPAGVPAVEIVRRGGDHSTPDAPRACPCGRSARAFFISPGRSGAGRSFPASAPSSASAAPGPGPGRGRQLRVTVAPLSTTCPSAKSLFTFHFTESPASPCRTFCSRRPLGIELLQSLGRGIEIGTRLVNLRPRLIRVRRGRSGPPARGLPGCVRFGRRPNAASPRPASRPSRPRPT